MSAKTIKPQFYLGIAFATLSIVALVFLLVLVSGKTISDLGTSDTDSDSDRYFNDYDDMNSWQESSKNLIKICCTWGEELADGELSYLIRDEGDNTNQESVIYQSMDLSTSKNNAVRNAAKEWDQKINGLTFREVQNRYDADIEIRFRESGGEAAGLTRNLFDRFGLITKSFITIYDREFPFGFGEDQIEQIAKHEIGHALGLGHANFNDSLMSTHVHYGTGNISTCETQAVYEANHWKLNHIDDSTNYRIYQPNSNYLECKNNA
jgi:predicted Zn-dependent protease